MRYLPDGAQMKSGDRNTIEVKKVPSMVLMERAALKTVERMHTEQVDLTRVLVVCGSGNNGGDGYAVARLLHLEGSQVTVVLAGRESSMSSETRLQREILGNYGVTDRKDIPPAEYTAVVDAVFGIGLDRRVEGRYADLLEQMNGLSGTKIAVDIPSGISSFTGEVLGTAFQADMTVTFACMKLGMALYPGASFSGKIFTEEIGIQADLFDGRAEVAYTYERDDLRSLMPERKPDSHKGTYGKVLMITGSKGMSGAAYLSAKAAYRTGAGLVKIYTEESNRIILQTLLPEAVVVSYREFDEAQLIQELAWADVAAVGCGLGTGELSRKLVKTVCCKAEIPIVMDADALNLAAADMELLAILAKRQEQLKKGGLIVTPHLKEMSRLLGCSMEELLPVKERMSCLRQFAETYRPAVCVLKDARTLVQQQGKRMYVNTSGCSAMAKGGSGDVLAGILAGLLAQHLEVYAASVLGTYLHGLAGETAAQKKGNYSTLAEDLLDGITGVLKG